MEVRPCGEDWEWLCEDSLKGLGCGAPQPRESRKKPGPAREAGCRCWEVWEERGWSTKVTSFSVASQPSGHCLHELRELALARRHLGLQKQCRPLLQVCFLCAGAAHCSHLPASICGPTTPRVPQPGANCCPRLPGSACDPPPLPRFL